MSVFIAHTGIWKQPIAYGLKEDWNSWLCMGQEWAAPVDSTLHYVSPFTYIHKQMYYIHICKSPHPALPSPLQTSYDHTHYSESKCGVLWGGKNHKCVWEHTLYPKLSLNGTNTHAKLSISPQNSEINSYEKASFTPIHSNLLNWELPWLTYWPHDLTFAPHKVKLTSHEPPTLGGRSKILHCIMIPTRYVHIQEYVRVITSWCTGHDNPFFQFDELVWCGPAVNKKKWNISTWKFFQMWEKKLSKLCISVYTNTIQSKPRSVLTQTMNNWKLQCFLTQHTSL